MISWLLRRQPHIPLGSYGPRWLQRQVTFPLQHLQSHIHVIGTTGSGKSRFLAGLLLNLLERGYPITLIDPHGDLARLVLAQLTARGYFDREPDAFERVRYLDFPVAERQGLFLPFNVLRQPFPAHSIAANVMEALHRAWPTLANGTAPMFDTFVLNGVKLLISNDLPLPSLYQLLTDAHFRNRLLRREEDPAVVGFFQQQFDRLPVREQLIQAGSTLRRAQLLTFTPVLRYSLGQTANSLDIRAILDGRQSLIINLALPDSEARRLLGGLLTVGYEQAALSRSGLPMSQRSSHHLVIDEAFDFLSTSQQALARMLSLTRKMGLYAVLAHQTWSQVGNGLQGALQNVGLEVAFRLGRRDAEQTAASLGRVDPGTIKHRVNDPSAAERGHPLFSPLVEQWETWVQALQDLKPRQAFVQGIDGRLRKLRTLPVSDPSGQEDRLHEVEAEHLRRWFRPLAEIENWNGMPTSRDRASDLTRQRQIK